MAVHMSYPLKDSLVDSSCHAVRTESHREVPHAVTQGDSPEFPRGSQDQPLAPPSEPLQIVSPVEVLDDFIPTT